MSLASRLVNLFSPNQPQHLTRPNGHSAITLDPVLYDAKSEAYPPSRARHPQESVAMEEEEIEGRPPYWHVCWILKIIQQHSLTEFLTNVIVYDSRWNRGDDRRSSYAFSRYC